MQTPRILLALIATGGLALGAQAQSMRVFGANVDARTCFESARRVVAVGGATEADVRGCGQALDSSTLSRSDRAATHVNRGVLRIAVVRGMVTVSACHAMMGQNNGFFPIAVADFDAFA